MAPRTTFPGVIRAPWYTRELTIPILAGVSALMSLGAATTTSNEMGRRISIGICAIAVLTAVIKAMHGHHKDRLQKQKEYANDLLAALWPLYHVLKPAPGSCDPKLRMTVYKIDGDELEQVVPYVGASGGEPGRRLSKRAGVVGRAAMSGQLICERRTSTDGAGFIREMISRYHFTREEAQKLDFERCAWLAVPVCGNDEKPIAVVYLDSTDPTFFNKKVKDLVIRTCDGIASYALRRAA